MPFFQKNPMMIEAIQFTGDNILDIWKAFGRDGIYGPTDRHPTSIILTTAQGQTIRCGPGEWVIRDAFPCTFYPCDPIIFAATYGPVDRTTDTQAPHIDLTGWGDVWVERAD